MIDYHIRDVESMFPHSNTVYDYYINNEKNEWMSWDEKISATVWKPGPKMPYHKMLVPTVDSARNRFVIQNLLKNKIHILCVGNTGTGKTAVINGLIQELDDQYTSMNIVFSA
jgi:dynein heavy chain